MVPLVSLVVGLGLLAEAVIFVQDAQRTRGQVIDIRANRGDDGVSYTPIIRYRRNDGQTFEAETHISSSGYDFDIGERVGILYSRDAPGEVRIDSVFSLYGPGLILSAVGAGFLWIVGLFWRRPKEAPPPSRADRPGEAPGKAGPWGADTPEPATTDQSMRGHVHKPKPKRAPTVRRMR